MQPADFGFGGASAAEANAAGAGGQMYQHPSVMSAMWGQQQVPPPPANLLQTIAAMQQQQQQQQQSQQQHAQLAAALGQPAYVNLMASAAHAPPAGGQQQQLQQQLAALAALSLGAGNAMAGLTGQQLANALAALQQQSTPSPSVIPLSSRTSVTSGANSVGPPPPMGGGAVGGHQQVSNRSSGGGGSRSPPFASGVATPQPPMGVTDWMTGYGTVTWLSSQAGLIESADLGTVSFQLKQFCDGQVHDLTAALRPGYKLRFNAVPAAGGGAEPRHWTATFVVPVTTKDGDKCGEMQAELEHYAKMNTGPPSAQKEQYCVQLEAKAVPVILAIFQKQSAVQTQLGNFHCHISNCGDPDLYNYIGTSSLKRRQFMERRTHLFHLSPQDLVSLQPPAVYALVQALAKRLLARGGVTALHELHEYYCACGDIPLEARELIGETKHGFLHFVRSHPWIFVVWPSRVFVAVRRQLADFDYAQFIDESFSGHELRAPSPAAGDSPTSMGGGIGAGGGNATAAGGGVTVLQRKASANNGYAMGAQGYYGQQSAPVVNYPPMQQANVQNSYYANGGATMPNGVQRTTSVSSTAANFWDRPAPVNRSASSHTGGGPPQRYYVTERQMQTSVTVPPGYELYARPAMRDAGTQTGGESAGDGECQGANGGSRLSPVVGGGVQPPQQHAADETKSGSTPTSGVRSASSSVFDEGGQPEASHLLGGLPQPAGAATGAGQYNPFGGVGFGLDSMGLLANVLGQPPPQQQEQQAGNRQ